ncbi:TetR/AcrR family transcriptional regulator [Streptomyces sp. G-G2]|nr:TetR/AcrR family transcriptional regulator [Streptomyces sp. G-G2]MDJ0385895.1 TetR/AcrR family transcriptional regulator [Streptomyces sp. G-G2]
MRPRTIDDDAILRAAVRVMGRAGPAKLTLAAVARECGLVAGTLVQRFGSKRGMLLALAAHGVRDLGELSARVRAEHSSPLDALAALITAAWSPLATPTAYANHLAFLCADLADAEFHRLALDAQRAQRAAVGELLELAHAELRPGTDTGALADAVQAAVTGAGLLWAVDREGELAGRQRAALAAALAPYRRRMHPPTHRTGEDPS